MGKRFFRYVLQNIAGMIGISCYLMADTFFISVCAGADGITALNLVLPIYNLIFAFGEMLAVGAATRYTILTAQNRKKESSTYLFSALGWGTLLCSLMIVPARLFTKELLVFLGADEAVLFYALPYTKTFLCFGLFFVWNYIIGAFVRNDNDPSLAMISTLCSSFFNIIFDYILIFPVGMGMTGAALATGISPMVGILVCSLHFFKKDNQLRILPSALSVKKLWDACVLGFSAFIGELATGITIMVFNFLLLSLGGNIAVAAYGIIANITLVGNAFFSGISFGCQPLFSESYGSGNKKEEKQYLKLGMGTALGLGIVLVLILNLFAEPIVSVFNSEGNREMAKLAVTAVHLYFIGYLFSSLNVVGCGYFSAVERPVGAFAVSILRSFFAIIGCAFLLSMLFGVRGVWCAFPAAEAITGIVMLVFLKKEKKKTA